MHNTSTEINLKCYFSIHVHDFVKKLNTTVPTCPWKRNPWFSQGWSSFSLAKSLFFTDAASEHNHSHSHNPLFHCYSWATHAKFQQKFITFLDFLQNSEDFPQQKYNSLTSQNISLTFSLTVSILLIQFHSKFFTCTDIQYEITDSIVPHMLKWQSLGVFCQ